MSFLATWKEPLQNRVLKLINKLLLFQYSERIFSAKKEGCYFDTCTQYTANQALFIELLHDKEFLFYAEILTDEYWNNRNWLMSFLAVWKNL